MLRSTPFIAIPVLALLVLAVSTDTSNRLRSTTFRVLPDVEMHVPPLILEGAFPD